MSVSARLSCGAALLLGLSLASLGAMAQDTAPAGATWTDPPARSAAPAASPTPAAKPPEQAKAPVPEPTRAAEVPATPASARRSRVRAVERLHRREARQIRRERVAVRTRTHIAHAPAVATYRPTRERVTRFSYRAAPQRATMVEALPVGRVEQPTPYGYGERDERFDRIRAAQAAGYIVVRSRSVQFPDGRSLRTYQPYAGDIDDE